VILSRQWRYRDAGKVLRLNQTLQEKQDRMNLALDEVNCVWLA
jgi:hypothetical protein